MTIRPARVADASAIASVTQRAIRATGDRGWGYAALRFPGRWIWRNYWQTFLSFAEENPAHSTARYFVALDTRQRIVGVVSSGLPAKDESGTTGSFYDLAVAPGAQRCGVGRALVAAAASDLAGRGFGRIHASVDQQDHVGSRFCEGRGGALVDEPIREDERTRRVYSVYEWLDLRVLLARRDQRHA